jgi:hypothetical protein
MPDSARVLRSDFPNLPAGRRVSGGALEHHLRDFEWGDSRNMMRGSIVGIGVGAGFWVALFELISLLKH